VATPSVGGTPTGIGKRFGRLGISRVGWRAFCKMARTNELVDAGTCPAELTEYLFQRMLALQHRSLANSSRRQYGITWRQWNQFCSDLGFSVWLPADRPNIQSLRMALFAVYCWTGRLRSGRSSANSIWSKLSHIKWYHRIYAGSDPQLTPSHGLVLAGMQRASPPPTSLAPVTTRMLQ
jgi:hypothetical protein